LNLLWDFQHQEQAMSSSTSKELWDAFSGRMAELAEQVDKSVVAVESGYRVTASGVHWKSGVVVTAAHLVRRAETVDVLLPGGTTVKGEVAGRDSATDLAAIRIEAATGVSTPSFSNSARLGELVVAVGRSRRGELAISAGLMARVGGPWQSWRGGQIERLLRPDVRLYPGQSGSALVNGNGEILGINTSVLARASTITLPVETVERVVNELLERGHILQPYLGVALQEVPLPAEWQTVAGAGQEVGLLVIHVAEDSPAKQAGVMIGDVAVTVGGEPVRDYRGLHRILAQKRTGEKLALRLIRSGSQTEVAITVGDRPRR
jgi:S1-C subfamily serine protease